MAGLIPQAVIDEILERTDIVAFIDEHVPLKKHGTTFTACCPFHHEKSPSFNVIPKKQFYYCFGCGASGNVISFMMQHLHMDFRDAMVLLAARVGLTLPESAASPAQKTHPSLYALLVDIQQFYHAQLKNIQRAKIVLDYLEKRGISSEMVERYQLGYAPEGWHVLSQAFKQQMPALLEVGMLVQQEDGKTYDRYRQRLLFPIHDRKGQVIGFGGRALEAGQKPKYLNSPETALFHKGRELYGLYQALSVLKETEPVIVVEGYLDVIALAQHGILSVVATLGTATTAHHLQRLSKYTRQVVFCFDGDAAGRKAAWRALEVVLPLLSQHLEAKFMFLPAEHDPDSFVRSQGAAAFLALMQAASSLDEFFFEHLVSDLQLDTLAGKHQLIERVSPYLLQIPEGIYRTLLIDRLAEIVRMTADRIHALLSKEGVPEAPTVAPAAPLSRSPLRLLIALLLQYPDQLRAAVLKLSSEVVLTQMDEPGWDILFALVTALQPERSVNTGMLVEQWRQSEWFDVIQRLSCWDHQVPEAHLEQEFMGIWQLLKRQQVEKTIQSYLAKSRLSGLSDVEKAALQALLKQRHVVS